jgi:hypothetical protein
MDVKGSGFRRVGCLVKRRVNEVWIAFGRQTGTARRSGVGYCKECVTQ